MFIQANDLEYEMVEPDTDTEVITFTAQGTADAAWVQIGNQRNHYTVVVSAPTGRATVKQGDMEPENEIVDLDL